VRGDSPTALLREQHRLILRVADALERAIAPPDPLPPVETIDAFTTFFRLYTDACHHAQEEDVLFPALEEQGMGDGAIDALREEHRSGRALLRSIAEIVPRLGDSDAAATSRFRTLAAAYIDFLRAHIAREDEGVFTFADHQLEPPACARVSTACETACAGRFDGMTMGQLERIATALIEPASR
jgi:hemerythrin-like domain-containing protein